MSTPLRDWRVELKNTSRLAPYLPSHLKVCCSQLCRSSDSINLNSSFFIIITFISWFPLILRKHWLVQITRQYIITCNAAELRNLECNPNTLSSYKHVWKGYNVSISAPPSSHGVVKASCVTDRCASHNGCHAVNRKHEKANCRHYHHQDDECNMTPKLHVEQS